VDERVNHVTVVRAGLEQCEVLRSVRLRALLCDPDAFGAAHEQESLYGAQFWEDRLVQSAWFLALAEGLPTGLVACVMPPPGFEGELQLDAMWVDPRWRGTGLSHRLVAEVVRYAVEANATALTLTVAETSVAARRCYERVGFEATGERFPRRGRPGQFSEWMRMPLAAKSH
jgi:ribosomal protein S18 acetylase RimI-like enzyme